MRNRCTNTVICMGMLAILVAMSPAALAIITDTSDLPPEGVYLNQDNVHELYEGAALKFILSLPEHRPFVGGQDPTGIDDVVRERVDDDEIEIFNSGLDAVLEVTDLDDNTVMGPMGIHLEGEVTTRVFGFHAVTEPGIGTFPVEMVALSLSMPNPIDVNLPDVSVQILPSPGEVSVVDLGNGTFQVDSFFDVFTELSIDTGHGLGLEVIPGSSVLNNDPAHMVLHDDPTIPEPGTVTLLAFAGLGLFGYRWRRKRAA